MLESPNLPDAKIRECLRATYGLTCASLDFLPIGYDASAWAYRVTTSDGERYFLKARRGAHGLGGVGVTASRRACDNGSGAAERVFQRSVTHARLYPATFG